MSAVTITEADFNLQGRVENYRERLTELLVELDRLVQSVMAAVNQEKLNGAGRERYEPKPPRWSLAFKHGRHPTEVNLIAFAHGGAWVIQGRMGLDRPFRNMRSARPRDEAAIRQEIVDQIETSA
jgi:acetyl esterase/lipase